MPAMEREQGKAGEEGLRWREILGEEQGSGQRPSVLSGNTSSSMEGRQAMEAMKG